MAANLGLAESPESEVLVCSRGRIDHCIGGHGQPHCEWKVWSHSIAQRLSLTPASSSGGSIFVWDALNFQLLRSFTTPVPRNLAQVGGTDVAHLIVSDSHVVGSVGNRVVAWRVDRRIPLGLASKGKNKGGGTARYISPKWQGVHAQ